jgi:hypothetical protein
MKDQIMNDINKNEFTEKKPIIDLLALWEEVDDMISERRAIERGNSGKRYVPDREKVIK